MSISEGFAGRELTLTWNSAEIAAVREKSVTINGEAIDTTNDDSDGWRTLLNVPSQNQVDISVSGVTMSQALKTDLFAGTRTRAVVITYPDGATLAGNFYLSEYVETGAYNDAVTFEATLMSTGEVIFTA
jgi:predicted secreted protein